MFPARFASREQLAQYQAKKEHVRRDADAFDASNAAAAVAAATAVESSPEHRVVALEECHCDLPKFDFPHSYKGYDTTKPSEVAERIKDATIVIGSVVPILPADMDGAPSLQCIAITATGVSWLEKGYCAKRNITVLNCPQSNIPAVSEHCIGLYFAVRKKTVEMHRLTTETDEWAQKGTLTKRFEPLGAPLSAEQECMGIIGYGALGKRIEVLSKAIGFGEILIAERKGEPPRQGRTAFQAVLTRASVLVICCPKDAITTNLIGKEDLRTMRKDACIINIARGGIVNEQALADALRHGWISGAATDVLDIEPGKLGGSPLLPKKGEEPVPNFTISPHISWFSVKTIKTLQKLLKDGVSGFIAGSPPEANIVVHNGKVYR